MSYVQPNYSRLSPCVIVNDVKKSIDFYTKVFGFSVLEKHENDGEVTGATLKLDNVTFMVFSKSLYPDSESGTFEQAKSLGSSLYVYCPNVDELYQNAVDNGATSLTEPEDAFWGDRYCQLHDLDGYTWCFATYKQAA